ncbi:MAG TPA: HPr(Ser) kinase/phosphatase [Verrucomicrobia bacterium]|nr:HPr(Ser) kinase/phosphatase [Verrucomicrobiota bacterium]
MAVKDQANKRTVKVSDFLSAGSERLKLEVLGGSSGLSRLIGEAAINRPGLGLAGFFKYFPEQRIQVIGLAEHAFLDAMSEADRSKRSEDLFAMKVPCIVFTRGKRVHPEILALAEKYKVAVLRTPLITKHFVNAATIIMENLWAPRQKIQGTMVEIMGIGVLIEGTSGVGKSDTALALVQRGHSLVADDITSLRRDTSGALIASPVKVTQYHMEIRGLGIIHVPSLFGVASVREEKKLDLVVTLCSRGKEPECDGLQSKTNMRHFLGVDVPQVFVTVEPGRDLANVVETAALNMKLLRLGHDAEKELDERLMSLLSEGRNASE